MRLGFCQELGAAGKPDAEEEYHEEQANACSSGVALGRGQAETDAVPMGSKSSVLNETDEVAVLSMDNNRKAMR